MKNVKGLSNSSLIGGWIEVVNCEFLENRSRPGSARPSDIESKWARLTFGNLTQNLLLGFAVREFKGVDGDLSGKKICIIVSAYHLSITQKLLDGAIGTLKRHQVPEQNVDVLWVPGSWELPGGLQMALKTQQYAAAMVFGCVIRGETTHDQHINTTVSQSLGRLSVEHSCPVGFGLLTCNSMDQAIARSGGQMGNKGEETADAVIHMIQLQCEVESAAS